MEIGGVLEERCKVGTIVSFGGTIGGSFLHPVGQKMGAAKWGHVLRRASRTYQCTNDRRFQRTPPAPHTGSIQSIEGSNGYLGSRKNIYGSRAPLQVVKITQLYLLVSLRLGSTRMRFWWQAMVLLHEFRARAPFPALCCESTSYLSLPQGDYAGTCLHLLPYGATTAIFPNFSTLHNPRVT